MSSGKHRIPHVLDNGREAGASAECLAAVIDVFPMGVVILDRHSRIRHMNPAAAELIEQNPELLVDDGELTANDTGVCQWFRKSLHELLRGDSMQPRVFVFRGAKDASQLLNGLLVRLGTTDSCAFFLSDPASSDRLDVTVLRQLWRFTPAEARVAAAFAELETAESVAREIGVRPHTVRSQLKQVFDKTGTRRRAMLVRTLCRGLAALRLSNAPDGEGGEKS